MNPTKPETPLIETTIHRGIFVWPVIILLVSAVVPTMLLIAIRPMIQLLNNPADNHIAILYALPFLILLIPNAVLFLFTFLAYRNSRITITTARLIFRTGTLFRLSGEIPLEKIESIFLFQPVFGRIFNYGTVCVRGTGGTPFNFSCISDPQHFHAILQQAIKDRQAGPPQPPPPPATDDSRYMPKH